MTTTEGHQHDLDQLADTLFAAFERNDPEAIQRCCSPDARFSQNGSSPTPISQLLPGFARLRERIGQHRYGAVRRGLFADGFVEEHDVTSVLPDGTPISLRACVVARVDASGLITELNEYLDPAAMRPRSTS